MNKDVRYASHRNVVMQSSQSLKSSCQICERQGQWERDSEQSEHYPGLDAEPSQPCAWRPAQN